MDMKAPSRSEPARSNRPVVGTCTERRLPPRTVCASQQTASDVDV